MPTPELPRFAQAVEHHPFSRMTKNRYKKRWPDWVVLLIEYPHLAMALCRDLQDLRAASRAPRDHNSE